MITKKQVMKILDIQADILWSQRRRKISTINKLVEKGYILLATMGFTADECEQHLKQ